MAFLELNGLVIPVTAESGQDKPIDIGNRTRAFDGSFLSDRRARKRMWSASTTPQSEMVSRAIEGAIAGLGEVWPFNFTAADLLTHDPYGSKGTAPAVTILAPRFGIGADGDLVEDENGVAESKYGNGSMIVEPACTNLLTNNQADVEGDTSGFTIFNGASSIAVDTSNYIQGAQSLKVVCTAINQGVDIDKIGTGSGTGFYSCSVYVKSEDSRSINVQLIEDPATVLDAMTVTVPADTWVKFTATGNATVDGDVFIRIHNNTASAATFYVDAAQISKTTAPRTWRDPAAGQRTIGDFELPVSVANGATDLTVAFWAKPPTAAPASTASYVVLAELSPLVSSFVVQRRTSGNLRFSTKGSGAANNLEESSPGFDGGWHHIACVLRAYPETGENEKTIYIDGVSVETANPSDPPDLLVIDTVRIGHSASNEFTDSPIDDLIIVPWAMTTAQVLAIKNMGVAMSSIPRQRLTGDIIPEASKTVEGLITQINRLSGHDSSGNFKSNLSSIQFELQEV
jgi:hypothetical protein